MNNDLIFKNFRFRCHRLGDLMTNLPGLTAAETKKLDLLTKREEDFKAGNLKLALTQNMKDDLASLITKRDKEDSLPAGAISYLDTVFDEIYWRRKRILRNKYLDKGLLNEQDVLNLHSQIDNADYFKNEKFYQNEHIEGTPDNIFKDIVRDAKANYDLETFRKAELTTGYKWQLKGYLWLTGKSKAQLMYGLVNNPLHQITNEIVSIFYSLGQPDDDNEDYMKAKMQVERNMIFDHKLFREEYPEYTFHNPVLDFDIPEILRAKKFDIELEEGDIINMKTRVALSRIYLCEKEIAVRKLDGTLIKKN